MDELIHLVTERIVLFCQPLRQMLLIDDLLRRLVAVECQSAACTLHDNGWAEAAQNARLVIL